jgi:AcrR family transcriptional regulator
MSRNKSTALLPDSKVNVKNRSSRKTKRYPNRFRSPSLNGASDIGATRNRILQTATRLFMKQGFMATTTRQIAEQAGVNEALIFYYFKDKHRLRWAVLEERRHSNPVPEIVIEKLRSGLPEKVLFRELAEELLDVTGKDDNMLRLLLSPWVQDSGPSHPVIARFYREHVHHTYEVLAKYIRGRIRSGAYRKVDPWLASRAFFSLIGYHTVIQEFMGGKYSERFGRKHVARTLADIWLEGVQNHEPPVVAPVSELGV